ncbi:MAG: hypothetical protein R3F19_20640 [Verrucomicrobiales bacterium]
MKTVSLAFVACSAGVVAGWFLSHGAEKSSSHLNRASNGVLTEAAALSSPESDALAPLFDPNASEYDQLLALALAGENAFSERNRDMSVQVSELESISDSTVRNEARDALFREWIAKEPTAPFALLRTRSVLLPWAGEYFQMWMQVDATAVIDAFQALPMADPLRIYNVVRVINDLANLDSEVAIDAMRRFELTTPEAFAMLAKRDVGVALSAMDDLCKSNYDRQNALRSIVKEWALVDVDAALAYADNAKEDRANLIRGSIEVSAAKSPLRAVQLAEQHLTGKDRSVALTTAVGEWSKGDPASALAYATAISNKDERTGVMSGLVTQLANSDHFELALKALNENSDDANILQQAENVFAAWSTKDWDAAASAALNFPDSEGRLKAIQGLMRKLPQIFSDEGSTDQWATSLIDVVAADAEGNGSLYVTPSLLTQLQPETLRSLIADHGSLLQNALPYVVPDIAAKDAAFALELVGMITDPEVQNRIALDLAIRNIETDPASAAEESALLNEGKVRNTAFRNVANTWTRSDPLAARNWIASLEPSPARDVAAAEYVDVIAGRDPENALAVAREMSDASQREEAVGDVLAAWVAADVDRASEAMAGMQIPESVSDRVNKALQEARAWQKLSR